MSTEDKKVDVNENEVETTDNATKAANNEKKEKISAHKKATGALGRLWKKGKKIARDHAFEVKMAGMVAGGLVGGATEANAQNYTRPTNAVEMSVDQIQRLQQQGGSAAIFQEAARQQRQTTQRQYYQGGQVQQQSPMQQANAMLQSAADFIKDNGWVIDARLSMGLRQRYVRGKKPIACAAYHPLTPETIYFIPTEFRGNIGIGSGRSECEEWQRDPNKYTHVSNNPYLYGGYRQQSAYLNYFASQGIPIDNGYGLEAGGRPVGGVYVDGSYTEMDAALDGAHEFLEYAAAGAELIEHGLDIAAYGKHVVNKSERIFGKAPSGSRRSPQGGRIPGSRGGRR